MTDEHEAMGPLRVPYPAERRRRRKRTASRLVLGILAAAIVAGLAAGIWLLIGPGSGAKHTLTSARSSAGASRGFHVTYPKDWKQVKSPPAPASAGPVVGALRQLDGEGVVIFHRAGRAGKFTQKFVQGVNDRLRKSIPDYRFSQAEILHLHDVNALYFAYYRTKKKTLTTITVVPAGDHSWVIDTLSPESSTKIAKEIGGIIRSLRLT